LASARSAVFFFFGAALAYIISSYVGGFLGIGLGEEQYYPPSSNALVFLREIPSQSVVFPVNVLEGLLLGLAFYPFRKRVMELGRLYGGLSLASVLFVLRYLTASLDQLVYYSPIPAGYYLVVSVELLVQSVLFGQLLFLWEKRFGRT
jgi:hypothetical protein